MPTGSAQRIDTLGIYGKSHHSLCGLQLAFREGPSTAGAGVWGSLVTFSDEMVGNIFNYYSIC